MAQELRTNLVAIPAENLHSIGIVLDADSRKTPSERFEKLRTELAKDEIVLPDSLGAVGATAPHCGAYMLPDNLSQGTLEDVLLACADTSYPELLAQAQDYVGKVQGGSLSSKEQTELRKPSGPNKATIAAITAVLKPGRTTQVSISDNRWLTEETRKLAQVAKFERFLADLLA